MNMANDGSLNRHGGQAAMESNADERARERAEAVEARMLDILTDNGDGVYCCPECDDFARTGFADAKAHLRDCELLRARAENEVDAAERGR